MKRALWGFLALLAAIWSLLAWAVWQIAGSGGRVVTWLTDVFQIEPSSTQWLADGLQMAGGLAQAIVILFWLMGLGALGMVGILGGRTAAGVQQMSQNFERELERERVMRTPGAMVEGEIMEKSVERDPRP